MTSAGSFDGRVRPSKQQTRRACATAGVDGFQVSGEGKKLGAGDGVRTTLTSADADGFEDIAHEDLAVTDLAGVGGFDDGIDDGFAAGVFDDDLDLHFGTEVHSLFGAAVDVGTALLTAESFDLDDGHAFHSHFREGFFDVFEFEGLDDRFDFFHG